MDEIRATVIGWREVDGEWYCFREDGDMNPGEPILDNRRHGLSAQGAPISAGRVEDTGEGAYDAGYYDHIAQDLFDQLNEEKKYLFFEEYPGREDECDGDMHRVYDWYAGLQMDMTLNRAANHRLGGAMAGGYVDGRIPGEDTISDCLSVINYGRSASCLESHVRDREDVSETLDRIKEKLDKRFQSKTDRKYSLEHYRSLGMAHGERDERQYFVVILMR